MKRWAKGFKLSAGAVLIILSQFLCSHETGAADPSSLRVVYNALGATMSPAWIAQDHSQSHLAQAGRREPIPQSLHRGALDHPPR
jgi:hypothetical protein